MAKGAGSGDKLARGAISARFCTTEGGMSQEKWDQMFNDYNPEEFKNAPNKSRQRIEEVSDSDAGGESSGIPVTNTKESTLPLNSD